MATLYPGGDDTFTEPSLPEETPLSSAGSSNPARNHVESHRDLGDAVEAIQANASIKTHNHDGTDSRTGGPKLAQANTHQSADTDSGLTAIHHTLGTGANQAAQGNHTHDYNSLPGAPFKICTSSTRPGSPVLGMVIYETDTKAFRQWDLHANNVVVTGLNSLEEFPSTFTDGQGRVSMNPADWEQWYSDDPVDYDHGAMGVASPGTLSWVDQGSDSNRAIARRIKLTDKETQTDDQVITWKTGGTAVEATLPLTEDASNDYYLRMSADKQSYLRIQVGHGWIKVLYTTTGVGGELELGTLNNVDTALTNTEFQAQVIGRTITIYRVGETLGTIKDTKSVTAKGASNRGWGVGMLSGDRFTGQTTPGSVDWVRIQDARYYASVNRWSILPLGAMPVCRLRQAKAQQISHTGTILEFEAEVEDNFNFFNSGSSKTSVVITEPGRYDVTATIQWDTSIVPDQAHAVVMLNGQETYIKDSKFLRGNGFSPGFSQTLAITGSLWLAEGDVVQVKARYAAASGLLNSILSFFDGPSKVDSRFELLYRGP
jgi:hypothetical protein